MSERVAAAAARIASSLAAAGIEQSGREARLLLGQALGLDRAALLTGQDRELTRDEESRLAALVARRVRREPLSRIVGHREFWSLEFALGPGTLDPRPDSETLVQGVLDTLPDRRAAFRVLDLGTGSGCLLLALLSELPAAWGVGVDISPEALHTARANARALGMADRAGFVAGDWGQALTGHFDAILINPPYIPGGEIGSLAPEVALFDPRMALDGGPDGLGSLRRLAPDLARLLASGGVAAVEIGAGQAQPAGVILAGSGMAVAPAIRDLAGVGRCLLARLK